MNPELTKLIEQFLAGELSTEDTKAFENRIESNETLREAVEQQRAIHEASKRSYQRQQIKQVGKRYHLRKNFLKGGLSLMIIGALTAASLFFINRFESELEVPIITDEAREVMNENAPFGLPVQYFVIPEEGGVALSEQGVLISVPEGAFTLNGKPYKEPVALQFQEALKGSDILKSGLSTTSNGRLLETGGMIGVTGYTINGKPLDFNEKVGVYVQVPTSDDKMDMQLFDGELKADSSINWINPEKLEKIPVPVSMSELDFYPSGYEDYLDDQKWKQSKESRDSLYLSFEEEDDGKAFISGENLFKMYCATCHHPTKDGTGNALAGVRDLYRQNGASDNDVIQFVKNWQVAAQNNEFAYKRTLLRPTAMSTFESRLTDKEIVRILDYIDEVAGFTSNGQIQDLPLIPNRPISEEERDYLYGDNRPIEENMSIYEYANLVRWKEGPNYNDLVGTVFAQNGATELNDIEMVEGEEVESAAVESAEACSYILPSNVLAFWNPQFNKTNLSTREFERRMQEIHQTCNNDVLSIYTNNLDKSIGDCDRQVVAMGYDQFERFAAENVGKLKAGNPHVKQLQKYYKKSVKQLKYRNNVLQNQEKKRRSKHDSKTKKSRFDEMDRRTKRESQAYSEEYNYNLDNVYKQLGRTRGFTIRKSSPGMAAIQERQGNRINTAVKNIDRLVSEATINRESTTIVDPETGKTAELTYNDFSFEVDNADQYIKLFAYVMPYELNSYQRIEGKNGKFEYPLNNDIRYNVAIVGVKENEYAYYQQLNIKGGKLGKISLQTVSESRLNANVKQLNQTRNVSPMSINSELEWLYQEQKDYKEQKMRLEMSSFREAIRCIIFPCCQDFVNDIENGEEEALEA